MDMLLLVTTVLALLVAYLLVARRKLSSKNSPPQVPGALPILGHALQLKTPLAFDEWKQKYGDVYTINLAGTEAVVVHDYDLMKNCLRSEELGFMEIVEKRLGLDKDVIARRTTARMHQTITVMKQTIFSRAASAEPVIAESCKDAVDRLLAASPNGKLDVAVNDLAKLIVGDSTGRIVFQIALPVEFYDDCAAIERVQGKAFRTMSAIPFRARFFKRWVYKDYLAGLDLLYNKYLKALIQNHRANPGNSDFIDALLNFKAEDDVSGFGAYTDFDIAGHIVSIVLASMANTTLLTTHVISTLMLHKNYFERVRDEVRKPDACRNTTPVLEAVVYENARLACAVIGSMRVALGDIKLAHGDTEYVVNTGSAILMPHYSKNYDPKLFENPHEFNPDRFINTKERKSDVMTWGGGIHMCPGKNLALTEARVIAMTLVQNYDLEPVDISKYGKMVWAAGGTAISPINATNRIMIKQRM